MKAKCVFWGMGNDYERLLNQILFEESKGNIQIIALVCKKGDIFCSGRDGYRIVTKEVLRDISFDYIVITAGSCYKQIKQEALEMGVSEKNIIDGRVFSLPLFDFNRYIRLVSYPVTILSDDCWGAMCIII